MHITVNGSKLENAIVADELFGIFVVVVVLLGCESKL